MPYLICFLILSGCLSPAPKIPIAIHGDSSFAVNNLRQQLAKQNISLQQDSSYQLVIHSLSLNKQIPTTSHDNFIQEISITANLHYSLNKVPHNMQLTKVLLQDNLRYNTNVPRLRACYLDLYEAMAKRIYDNIINDLEEKNDN